MALTNTPKRRWFRAGAFLFSLSPAIVLANLIARYSVNLPVMDDWPIGWFLFKSLNGDFSFAHLLAQANESRPVFPRLLFLSLAYVAGWDVRYQMALTLLFALLISYNLYRLCSITVPGNRSHRLILIFFVNLLVFSPIQYQNWFWGIQTIVFIPIFCLSTALLVSYTSCSAATKTLSAIVLSTISTFSYANGMICWVLIPPALFFQRRESTVKSTWWRLIYSVAMIFNVLLYFSNYQKPLYHPLLDYALSHLCQAFSYFFSFLGSPLFHFFNISNPFFSKIVGMITSGIFLVFVASISPQFQKNESRQTYLPWFCIAIYSFTAAILTTIGRSGFGVFQSLDSRYISFSIYLPVSLIFIGSILYHGLINRRPEMQAKISVPLKISSILFIGFYLVSTFHSLQIIKERHQIKIEGRSYLSLIKVMPRNPLAYLVYPDIQWLRIAAPLMQEKGLLKIPLLENRDLDLIQKGTPRCEGPCGRLEGIHKISKNDYEAYGWAFLPDNIEPAHAIFLAFKNTRGHHILFECAAGRFKGHLTYRGPFGDSWKCARGAWKVPFSTTGLPPCGADISAWAFDAISGKVYPLDRVMKIIPQSNDLS